MLDWRGYRGVVGAVCWIGAATLALNFALLLGLGKSPVWLVTPRTPLGWKEVERVDRVVAGLAAESARVRPDSKQGFCVYVGMSTAREGIDPVLLGAAEGRGSRYVGLCGSGGDIAHLVPITRQLLRSGLRPERVIIGLHAMWLVGAIDPPDPTSLDPVPHLLAKHWYGAARAVRRWDWIGLKRVYVNHLVRNVLYETRVRLFDRFRLHAEAFSPPSPDTWQPPPRLGYPQHSDAEHLREQMQGFEDRGWLDAAAYEQDGRERAQMLTSLVSRLKATGTDVVVVLMPEHSALRSRVPGSAVDILVGSLGRLGEEVPPVADFRSAIPDAEFTDYCHLNGLGRANFTAQLARWLKARGRPDLPGDL